MAEEQYKNYKRYDKWHGYIVAFSWSSIVLVGIGLVFSYY